MNRIEKSAIRTFLQNHLLTNCMLEKEIIQYIFHLLHGKGKIFSTDETHFSWGGFYAQVSSFHLKDDTCIQSIISHAAAIELLILLSKIYMDKAFRQIATHFPDKQIQIARLKRYLES
ncbi:hypothetical protein [Geobacillus sp. B4113_201601]|uniref:hypothetical protein n=1 Tax=Geobacillus sp. B4113_201601 TaxID=1586290 RepID=UPI000783729C|nr:hypothetical protein [Geobacillus sp. B4113_201601]